MNKWIEQEALKRTKTYEPLDAAIKMIWFEAGAHAVLIKVREIIEGIESNYPEDIFEPLKKDDIMPSRDRVSAQMARHTCQRILKELGEL